MKECLLFLSWQSDRKECRNFMFSVVDSVAKRVKEFAPIKIDRDTANVPGSPDIGDTIFEKIDMCDLFVADITLINDKDSGYRRTPNPNVMIELGYAIKTLGWERIILLQCEDYGDVEELPFDINHRRICSYTVEKEIGDNSERTKRDSKQRVIENISSTIHILLDKGMLFGGNKKKVPKFELKLRNYSEIMSRLTFKIRNVSSRMISSFQSHDLSVLFSNGITKKIECSPWIESSSLMPGEEASIHLRNQILGYGPGYNNYAWTNIELVWQFSCEDEDGVVYWYEMRLHIDDAEKRMDKTIVPVKYIG